MTIKDYSRRRALTFIDLYSKGISMGMIAVKFNISRQRVWQIIRKYEEYQNIKRERGKIKKEHNKVVQEKKGFDYKTQIEREIDDPILEREE